MKLPLLALTALWAAALLSVATPRAAQAVVIDISTSATYAFDVPATRPPPYISAGLLIAFDNWDLGDTFNLTVYDVLGGPEIGSLPDVPAPQTGPLLVEVPFDDALSNNTIFLTIAAGAGSLDVISVEATLRAGEGFTDSALGELITAPVPVPEPMSLALLLAGLAGIGVLGRRRIAS